MDEEIMDEEIKELMQELAVFWFIVLSVLAAGGVIFIGLVKLGTLLF